MKGGDLHSLMYQIEGLKNIGCEIGVDGEATTLRVATPEKLPGDLGFDMSENVTIAWFPDVEQALAFVKGMRWAVETQQRNQGVKG